jgi:hypothetical protein
MLSLGSDRLKISRQKLPGHTCLISPPFFLSTKPSSTLFLLLDMLMVCFLPPLFRLCVPYQARINLPDVCIDLEAI